MPDAVGNSFFDKHDLGLHTELFTPVMGDLIAAGVINGARKTIDRGKHVGNFILGDEKLYQIMTTDPNVMFSQASYTNDPFVISQIDNMVSINTAMEIDLTGQICSESIGPRQYSGTGGAFDFAYGAQHSKGGRGIIAINSTAKNGTISKIKAVLTPGSVVTISRNVADIIITEYGVAYMRGRSVRERALQLIAIAHPDFRGELTQQARAYGFI
jgi:acyl-CoA hydrolase